MSLKRDARRVVITGLGAVTPLGLNVKTTWESLVQGDSGVEIIPVLDFEDYPTRMAAPVKGFDPTDILSPREARRTAPNVCYALSAAHEAARAAQFEMDKEDPTCIGVEIGCALGGIGLIEEQRMILHEKGVRHINPTFIPTILVNAAACMTAIQMGIKGPVSSPVAACASGLFAIGDAARRISWGDAEVIFAGGTDSTITPLAVLGFSRLGGCSTRNVNPKQACAPFDANRDGTVIGEGAAILLLESLEHALERQAPILAEVRGYGYNIDSYHNAAPDPEGNGAARAIQQALREAGRRPEEIDWICAHGTATPLNDVSETRAIKKSFGAHAYHIPVSSNKGGLGHMMGAAGAISAVTAVCSMQAALIPPTINYQTPDPECDLDYVPNIARPSHVKTVLINSFGVGGQNACLVLEKWGNNSGT